MSSSFASPDAAIGFFWWLTLGLGLVVALVVAALLAWIHREAGVILGRVSAIWNVGQRVANNTVHIPALYTTNALAARILAAAARTREAVTGIEAHARECSGCPQCLAKAK
jgi:flagellar biosynthesis component FlhA